MFLFILLLCTTHSALSAVYYPPNDDFSAARQLPGDVRWFSRSIGFSSATAEPGEPPHNGQPVLGSAWFRWTPTDSGLIELTTSLGSYAMALDVFEGHTLTRLAPVVANHVVALMPAHAGAVLFRALAGRTYYFRLPLPYSIGGLPPAPGTLRLRYVSADSLGWHARQRLLIQSSTFSVHPSMLTPLARSLYDRLWVTAAAPPASSRRRGSGGTSSGSSGVVVVNGIELPPWHGPPPVVEFPTPPTRTVTPPSSGQVVTRISHLGR